MKVLKIFILSLSVSLLTFTSFAEDLQSLKPLKAEHYNDNANLCCFIDWGVSGWLSKSQKFPDADVFDLKTKTMVKLSSLVKTRPIVLQMGSLTCPSYDLNVSRFKKLVDEYGKQVDFYTLYVRENHPTDLVSAHRTFEQKVAYAEKLASSITGQRFIVDDVNGTLHQKLGNFGNAVYLIGTDMHTNHWSIFPDTKALAKGIQNLQAAKGLAKNSRFNGGSDTHSLISTEFSAYEKNDTTKRMQSLEGPNSKTNGAKVAALYDSFSVEQPELHRSIPPQLWKKMKDMSVYKVEKDMTDQKNKATWNNLFLTLKDDFRGQYKQRYTEWKKINHINDRENITDQILGN